MGGFHFGVGSFETHRNLLPAPICKERLSSEIPDTMVCVYVKYIIEQIKIVAAYMCCFMTFWGKVYPKQQLWQPHSFGKFLSQVLSLLTHRTHTTVFDSVL